MDRKWLDRFNAVAAAVNAAAARWKQRTGGKAVALLHTDVPEELVMAAGALPLTVLAEGVTLGEADKYFQGFACSYTRSALELLSGGGLKSFDGVITPYICDTTRSLDLVLKFNRFLPYTECLRIPKTTVGTGVRPYYLGELARLRDSLAGLTGQAPTDATLRDAIRQVNRVRDRLSEVRAALRGGRVSAAEYLGAVRASLCLPKDEAETLLNEFLADAAKRKPTPADLPTVLLAGKLAEPPALAEVIEAAGVRVVDDLLVLGARYVEGRADEAGDPLAALTDRQLRMLPMTGVWDESRERAEAVIKRVRAANARGVIILVQKFCEPWEIDYPGIKEALDREGIPNLRLETEYQTGTLEPLRTRVQAFAEMIG